MNYRELLSPGTCYCLDQDLGKGRNITSTRSLDNDPSSIGIQLIEAYWNCSWRTSGKFIEQIVREENQRKIGEDVNRAQEQEFEEARAARAVEHEHHNELQGIDKTTEAFKQMDALMQDEKQEDEEELEENEAQNELSATDEELL